MHGEDLFINDGGYRQAVEAIGKRLPEFDVIPPLALIVEAVDPVNRRALVVSAQHEKVFRILDLVGEEKANCLERLFATVDVIPEKEIVCFGRESAVFKQAKEIVILTVNIPAYLSHISISSLTSAL